jgi:hypothetical protein
MTPILRPQDLDLVLEPKTRYWITLTRLPDMPLQWFFHLYSVFERPKCHHRMKGIRQLILSG